MQALGDGACISRDSLPKALGRSWKPRDPQRERAESHSAKAMVLSGDYQRPACSGAI